MSIAKIRSFDDFLALFPDKPRSKTGSGWLVLCPAHNDHTPSLWVAPSDNPAFIASFDCKAGCAKDAVLKAKNLSWTDVGQNDSGPESKKQKTLVATFGYEYEKGQDAG